MPALGEGRGWPASVAEAAGVPHLMSAVVEKGSRPRASSMRIGGSMVAAARCEPNAGFRSRAYSRDDCAVGADQLTGLFAPGTSRESGTAELRAGTGRSDPCRVRGTSSGACASWAIAPRPSRR